MRMDRLGRLCRRALELDGWDLLQENDGTNKRLWTGQFPTRKL